MFNYVQQLENIAVVQQTRIDALKAARPKMRADKAKIVQGSYSHAFSGALQDATFAVESVEAVLKSLEVSQALIKGILDQIAAKEPDPSDDFISYHALYEAAQDYNLGTGEKVVLKYERRRVPNSVQNEFIAYAEYYRDGRLLGNLHRTYNKDGGYFFAPIKCVDQALKGPFRSIDEAREAARNAQPFDLDMGPYALHDKNGPVEAVEPTPPGDNGPYMEPLVGALYAPIWTTPEPREEITDETNDA